MPLQGFKSVTLRNNLVDRIEKFIKNNRGKTIPNYVNSPAALLEYYHKKITQEKDELEIIAKKIKVIPDQVMRYTI